MSEEAEMLSLGRLVKSAADAKKNVVLLKGTLEAIFNSLNKASLQINGVLAGMTYPYTEALIKQIPAVEVVQSALNEYLDEQKRSAELTARLAERGL